MSVINDLFYTVLSLSYKSVFVVIFILAVRFFIRKLPKSYSFALWAVLAFRLICPVSFESAVSLFNSLPDRAYYINTVIPSSGGTVAQNNFNADVLNTNTAAVQNAVNSAISLEQIAIYVYIAGVLAFAIYGVYMYIKTLNKVKFAVKKENNIYYCDNIASPFVLGFIRPKIYIPFRIEKSDEYFIILHEKYHIKRKDNILKLLAYILLCIHFFNPFVWIYYYLFEKDMEMSCDEKVIHILGADAKKQYSSLLLSFAMNKRHVVPSPVSFGESGVKSRIKNVLMFKKPKMAVGIIAVLVCIIVFVTLGADPFSGWRVKYTPVYTQSNGSEAKYEYTAPLGTKSVALYGEIFYKGSLKGRYVISSQSLKNRKGSFNLWFKGVNNDTKTVDLALGQGEEYNEINIPFTNNYYSYVTKFLGENTGSAKGKDDDTALFVVSMAENINNGIRPIPCESIQGSFYNYQYLLAENDMTVALKAVVSNKSPDELRTEIEKFRPNELFAVKNKYIGDNVADGRVLGALGIGYDLGHFTTELQTSSEPYSIKLVFENAVNENQEQYLNSQMEKYSLFILALIENAGEVQWEYPLKNGGTRTGFYTQEMADDYLKTDIKSFGTSPENLAELMYISGL